MTPEEFLKTFHDNKPGLQSAGVDAHRTAEGRTAYEEFADRVGTPERVLDLGCADGGLLEVLAGRGAKVLAGVDLSEAELALARKRPALANADLRQARAQELPFPDASFDAVVSHMAFMLMTDPERVVAEAARVLVPGGSLSLAVGGGPVAAEGMELFLDLARPYFEAADRPMPKLGERRTRSREGLDEILSSAGFELVGWDSIVLDMGGTAEHVWETNFSVFYDVVTLDEDQLAKLRREFLEAAGDGRVACGMRINIATAQLRTAETTTVV